MAPNGQSEGLIHLNKIWPELDDDDDEGDLKGVVEKIIDEDKANFLTFVDAN